MNGDRPRGYVYGEKKDVSTSNLLPYICEGKVTLGITAEIPQRQRLRISSMHFAIRVLSTIARFIGWALVGLKRY